MAKKKSMDDLISRQAVLDLYKEYQPYLAVKVYEFGERLKALDPVPTIEAELDEFEYKGLTIRQWADKITSGEYQPVKPAHWSINPDGYYPQCSNCGYEPPREMIRRNGDALIFPRYCPECGADSKREVK